MRSSSACWLAGGLLVAPDLLGARRIGARRGRSRRAGLRAACRPDCVGWARAAGCGACRGAPATAGSASDAARTAHGHQPITRLNHAAFRCRARRLSGAVERPKGVENVNGHRRAIRQGSPRSDAVSVAWPRCGRPSRISARRFHSTPQMISRRRRTQARRAARRRTSSRRTRSAGCAGSRAGSPRSRRRRAARWSGSSARSAGDAERECRQDPGRCRAEQTQRKRRSRLPISAIGAASRSSRTGSRTCFSVRVSFLVAMQRDRIAERGDQHPSAAGWKPRARAAG